jgi:hypothetical protein
VTEDSPLLAAGKLGARHAVRGNRQDAGRLHMGARGIDRPAAADRNNAEQASHQAGGSDAETARKGAAHRRRHHTAAPNSMTPSGSTTSTKVPFPYEDGIRRWPIAEWTRTYGAPGEVDEGGVVRKICVVPKPYQDPHPPIFQPFSVSENTIRYTARSGVVPWILVSYPPDFLRLCRLYREVAAESGRNLRLGEGVGAFRAVHFGRTEEEAVALFRDTNFAGFTIISTASVLPRRSACPRTRKNTRRRPCCRSPSGPSNGTAKPNTRSPAPSTK